MKFVISVVQVIFVSVILSSVHAGVFDDGFKNVNLRFFHGSSFKDHDIIYVNDAKKLLKHEKFNMTRETVIYTHGWVEKVNYGSIPTVVEAYIEKGGYNIVVVDWGKYSDGEYFFVVLPRVLQIGKMLGKVFHQLFRSGLDIELVHFVGFSFGAHISGIIGKTINKLSEGELKVKRISGLDPAGPGLHPPWYEKGLAKDDARFVDAIHSDRFWIGTGERNGHVDFYPDDALLQPGCPPLRFTSLTNFLNNFCSHMNAWRYWSQSLFKKFGAKSCNSFKDYKASKCDENDVNYMGYDADPNVPGVFFLSLKTMPKKLKYLKKSKKYYNY